MKLAMIEVKKRLEINLERNVLENDKPHNRKQKVVSIFALNGFLLPAMAQHQALTY
jgi:hypothetical protein